MKVLMIEPIGYSGICIYTCQSCSGLLQAGCEVALVTSRLYDSKAMKPVYPVYPFLGGCDRSLSRPRRALDYLFSWFKLLAVLRTERPNLIHLQNSFVPFLDILVLWALRLAGYKVVYTVHDVDRSGMMTKQKWRIRINRAIDRAVYRAVSGLIVHTAGSGAELRALYGIPAGRIHCIHHGNQAFHLEGFPMPTQSAARASLGLPDSAFVVLFFGDRRPSKGLDLLIRAFARARVEAPELMLLIAGERRVLDTTDYEGIARETGALPHCRFHDRFIAYEDVPGFFSASDIIALPYRKIYQSGVVHLSFAFSRPVLASRVGGLAEMVEDGKTGFFVEDPEDLAALSAALLKAYRMRDRMGSMGETARKVELEEYGWESIGQKTAELYRDVSASYAHRNAHGLD